uniref:Flavonol synthase n=1 Tax=Matthiola incana TaxID=3724 RepID=A0A7I6P974_MATIN|nr:flavonol synthase [Matthiola incana]
MEVERDQHTSPPIPIIDLNHPDEELVARAVVKATKELGFFQLVDHGIPNDLIKRLKEVGTQFLELSQAEKKAVTSEEYYGYNMNDQYQLENGPQLWAENLMHIVWPPSCINFNCWPKNPTQYREVVEEYTEEMKKLTDRLLRILSEGLGLQRESFKKGLGGETELSIAINNYPPKPQQDLTLGLSEHRDIVAIALIIDNDVPGLQIFKDDQWLDVQYIPHAISVTIGDPIVRLSNGKYKSVLHRATVNREKQRISWPFFVGSNPDWILQPLSELITDHNPSKFKPITCKEFKHRSFFKLPID